MSQSVAATKICLCYCWGKISEIKKNICISEEKIKVRKIFNAIKTITMKNLLLMLYRSYKNKVFLKLNVFIKLFFPKLRKAF